VVVDLSRVIYINLFFSLHFTHIDRELVMYALN